MSTTATWISTTLLPVSAAHLGRLVGDISNPQTDFQDTFRSSERPAGPEVIPSEIRVTLFLHDVTESRRWGLTAALTAILGSTLSIQKEEVVGIAANACTTQTLPNSSDYFDKACRSGPVRQWLERRWRGGRRAYMAVGIMMLRDARVTIRQAKAREVGQKLGVPGSVALLAATHGAVPTLGGLEDVLDSEVAVSHGTTEGTASSFSVPGDSIFAIQYQQVDFSWFRKPSSSRPVELKTYATWKAYLGSRGEDSDVDSDDGEGPGPDDDDDGGDCDNTNDAGYVTLQAQVGGNVKIDDVGEFNNCEDFSMDDTEEIWHIS